MDFLCPLHHESGNIKVISISDYVMTDCYLASYSCIFRFYVSAWGLGMSLSTHEVCMYLLVS